jgi:hypothetical protein
MRPDFQRDPTARHCAEHFLQRSSISRGSPRASLRLTTAGIAPLHQMASGGDTARVCDAASVPEEVTSIESLAADEAVPSSIRFSHEGTFNSPKKSSINIVTPTGIPALALAE